MSSLNKSVKMDKPRRLEEETAVYLSGLEAQLEGEVEDLVVLVDNVLEEIKQRTASAASDRRTNYVVERICCVANIKQLLEMIKRFTPYVLFLAQNRHSSHVLQTSIGRVCHLIRSGETYDVENDIIESTVLDFAEPILANFAWLAGEISGSHVLRSVICLLTGMPLISERKSASSKHQHSVPMSEPLDKLIVNDLYYIDKKLCFVVPKGFHGALYKTVESSLLGDGNGEEKQANSHVLQLMISDTSCCATLVILLRILFTPELVDGGRELAQRIVSCAMEWTSTIDSTGKVVDVGADVFYAMGGDKSGSYFLEAVIECCSVPFLIDMTRRSLLLRSSETIQEFVEDSVANFIIQSVLKRMTSVFNLHSTTNLPRQELDDLLKLANDILSDQTGLMKSDLFSMLVRQKAGVVLWMLKLGKSMTLRQEDPQVDTILVSSVGETIASKLFVEWTAYSTVNFDEKQFEIALDDFATKKFSCVTANDSHDQNDKKSKSNKPNAASLLIARLLGAILGMDGSDAALAISRMLCRLSHEILLNIACSGPISRSILDVFFESKCNGRERSMFLTTFLLKNLRVICEHPIAHHTLRKCFESASSIDKERVAEAVVEPSFYGSICHSREGKNVIRFTQCDLFSRNLSEWKALIVRQKKAQAMLVELDQVASVSHQQVPKPQQSTNLINLNITSQETHDDKYDIASNIPVNTTASSGRKRKRKRSSSKKECSDCAEDVPILSYVSSADNDINDIFGDGKDCQNNKKSNVNNSIQVSHDLDKSIGSIKKKSKKKRRETSGDHGFVKSHTSNEKKSASKRADFQKIKMLNSAKMVNIKKLTENL